MKSMSLSAKLIGGFIIVALVTLVVGFVGWRGVRTMNGHLQEVGKIRLPSVENLLIIEQSFEQIRVAQRTLLIPGIDKETRKRQYANVESAQEKYQKAWDIYVLLPRSPKEDQLWQEFVPATKEWVQLNTQFFDLTRELLNKDILDPTALRRSLEQFRGDHYKLEAATLQLIQDGKSFEGGEDHTACAFGKWMSAFTTSNATINSALQRVRTPHNTFHRTVGTVKQLMDQGKKEEALKLFHDRMVPAAEEVFKEFRVLREEAGTVEALYEQMRQLAMVDTLAKQKVALKLLAEIIEINKDAAQKAQAQADRDSSFSQLVALIGMFVGFAIALALGISLSLSITKPLKRFIEGLTEGAAQVGSASNQVSSASQQLAEGASEQAASVEETSASLEEMNSMTRQNSENANQADKLMTNSQEVIKKAAGSMKDMNRAMEEISSSGQEIGKIIKTIDEIAFQTNLLALNAAVEAARAGEAGQGFAVVADEVRNLAQRAADAAKNTAELIEGTITRIDQGSGLVRQTDEAFTEVSSTSSKVAELIGEITAASKEQAQGIEQITQAVTEMDKVTQTNAANAEESASASEELNAQAESMMDVVTDLQKLVGGANSRLVPTRATARSAATYRGDRKMLTAAPKKTVIKSSDVIPMDDDFDDF